MTLRESWAICCRATPLWRASSCPWSPSWPRRACRPFGASARATGGGGQERTQARHRLRSRPRGHGPDRVRDDACVVACVPALLLRHEVHFDKNKKGMVGELRFRIQAINLDKVRPGHSRTWRGLVVGTCPLTGGVACTRQTTPSPLVLPQAESLVLPNYHRMYDRLTDRIFARILANPIPNPELEEAGAHSQRCSACIGHYAHPVGVLSVGSCRPRLDRLGRAACGAAYNFSEEFGKRNGVRAVYRRLRYAWGDRRGSVRHGHADLAPAHSMPEWSASRRRTASGNCRSCVLTGKKPGRTCLPMPRWSTSWATLWPSVLAATRRD